MKKAKRATEDGLVDALAQTAFVTMAELNKIAAESELSLTLLRVGGILRDRRLRMATLARHLGLEKSTMSGLIDRAEKRGMVAREASPDDGRAIEVFLTREGQGLARGLEDKVRAALAPLTQRLDPAEQEKLRALLEKLLDPPEG